MLKEPHDLPPEVQAVIGNPHQLFGKYLLLNPLGKGRMGEVWKAWDRELKRFVALKFLQTTDENDLKRFQREATLGARLNHPNIVALHEFGQINGKHFIAMQYIEGETLRKKRLTLREAIDAVRQACAAIDYAHRQGIVHRDIKPGNIMITPANRVYVMDFGLARQMSPGRRVTISQTGLLLGTPGYMSPEQARGDLGAIDARSDVFSLGATLYYATLGRDPFYDPDVVQMIRKTLEEDPPPPTRIQPSYPRELENIVLKALEKDPARRYSSAAELAEDLRRFLDNEPVSARPPGVAYRLTRRFLLRRWQVLGASTLVLTFAALALVRVTDRRHRQESQLHQQQAAERERRRDALHRRVDEALALLQKFDERTCLSASPFDDRRPLLDQASRIADELQPVDDLAATAFLIRARCLFRRQNFEAAYEEFTRSIVVSPSPEAYYERGMTALHLYRQALQIALHGGRDPQPWQEKAVSDLREAASSNGIPELKAQIADAAVAYGEQRFADAIRLCDAILTRETDPRFVADVWKLKGYAHEQGGQINEAIEAFREAAALRPGDGEAHQALGSARARRVASDLLPREKHEEELNQAIRDLSTAIRIHPGFDWSYYDRGCAYLILARHLTDKQRDPSEAVDAGFKDFERVLAGPLAKHLGESTVNSMGSLILQRAHYLKAAGGHPRTEYERAIAIYRQGISTYPQNAALRRNLASALHHYAPLSDHADATLQQALDACSSALKIETSPADFELRGRIHHDLADRCRDPQERNKWLAQAQADYEQSVRLAPQNSSCLNSLGMIHTAFAETEPDPLPRLRRALDCFSQAVALRNLTALVNRGNVHYQIAVALIKRGERPVDELTTAVADWQMAIDNDPVLKQTLGPSILRARELLGRLREH